MAVNTINSYGRISITDECIAVVAGNTARECYGVVKMVNRRLFASIAELFNKENKSKGVIVDTRGDRIYIDLYVMMKYGVSIPAVAQSLKAAVKYDVEKFTGMIVATVNVNVIGVPLPEEI
ncbi:MAG: Asp23/Gls24 family envelope stress response protein [Firmicutes bacterium]|nr:Asp23/Gls24 family envelope stress response protein [Bacillota bacterium]